VADIYSLVIKADTRDIRKSQKDLDRFGKEAGQADTSVNRLGRSFGGLSAASGVLTTAIAGVIASLGAGAFFKNIINDLQDFEKRMLSINALLRANGNAAGFSAAGLRDQAESLALTTLQSTRGVLDAQKVLLSFRRVSGDTFTEVIKLSADLSAVMGTDLSSAALQLGKALENPIEGISALSRSGTTFTTSQKDMIRAMVETNRLGEAQALILAEVRAQVGGAGSGEAQGLAGAFDTLGQAVEEFGLSLGTALTQGGAFNNFINTLSTGINRTNNLLFGEEREAVELFNRQIELQTELNDLRQNGFLNFGSARQTKLELELLEVQERRRELVEKNEQAIRDQNQAEINGIETQAKLAREAAADQVRIAQEKQDAIALVNENARSNAVKAIVNQLQNETAALKLSDRALLQRELRIADATAGEQAFALASFDTAQALRNEAAALKEAAIAQKQQESALASIRGQLDPGQAEFTRYADQLDMIDSFNISAGEKEALREESFRQHQERMIQISQEGSDATIEPQMQGLKLFTDYQQTALSTVGQIFGNMADIAEKGGEKQFSTWKAMATAQAVVSTALAISNALASAPPPFNFALAATVGALGAVQVAQIQGTEYQGARAMGGSVTGGNSYLVGENGPEVVTMGGSGVVTPSSVGGGGMSVVINDQTTTSTGHDVQTQETTGPEGQRQMQVTIRDTVRRQMMQGEFDRQLGSKFDLKSKGRRV